MRLTLLLASVALLVGCGSSGPPVSTDGRNVGAVTVTLRVEPSRVRVGQAVSLRLRLVNNAGQATEVTYPSGQKYDYWITRDGSEVWRWSEGQMFVQAITSETLDAQSSLAYPEVWTPEAAGDYVAHARLTASPYDTELTGQVKVE